MKGRDGKIGRNDPCPCGSGQKYKKCCEKKGLPIATLRAQYEKHYKIRFKEPNDVAAIRAAGRLALDTLEMVAAELRAGMTTDEINTLVHDFTVSHNARPAPLNYRGFPKSVCVSVNEEICHGIPGPRVLQDGDIVNVDVTPVLAGYYADCNRTFFVGDPSPDARKLVDITLECLRRGIAMVAPGNTLGDIGWAIQEHAESHGCSVVREFVGHGVGFDFHEPPQVMHYGRKGSGLTLLPGMVFTIEPMINLGDRHLHLLDNEWTAITSDGSLSAQFEQTVLVTEVGVESLTPY
ncbi:MAG: type I methionyl aminopeptidase [Pseudomonadota bacterium]